MAAYERAIESRNVGELRAAYPGMTDEQEEAWSRFFRMVQRPRAEFTVERIEGDGTLAVAQVRGTLEYRNQSLHRAERAPVSFQALFRLDGGEWRLDSVR